jgi:hypothetical protein
MRKAISVFVAIVGFATTATASLADEIFSYQGNSFSQFFPNPSAGFPPVQGAVTGTVDLICDPCAAGSYTLASGPSGAMSFFSLSSGPGFNYNFSSSTAPAAGFTTEQWGETM